MNGVHTAVLVTTLLCLVGALLAAVGLRRDAGSPVTDG